VHDPHDPVPTRGSPALGLPGGPVDHADRTGGARPDVCSFTGAPLDEPLELAGPVVATIHAQTDAADADICVVLLDVAPDGRALNVADGYLRGRWRNGPGTTPLAPNAPSRFDVHCWNVAHRIEAGHRLRVDVSASSFPRYDVNPGTAARMALHTGGPHPSRISLTVRGSVL
jgi:putative CocE/NonD family hydrolase